VRTGVAQSKGAAYAVASDDQWDFKQHGFVELIAVYAIGRQSAVPEAGEHERIGRVALGGIEFGHGNS
jgi:hypothetical protein